MLAISFVKFTNQNRKCKPMTKQEAIRAFGSGAALARALGLTRGAISQWPDVLDQRRADTVSGAALRLGKAIPCESSHEAPPRALARHA
ncbi:Cro/CI family transcriptional regulator [Bordetella bronchiseptica]|uniref:Cro/CI family transcriptional regulator n=2 Tax=Bordetella bronchiseptica TaxID=518 RepID=UPI002E0E3996